MAEVYWIRLPEHTDVFNEGYVGVTNKTALTRYKGHIYFSGRSGNTSIIGNVIRKYGSENLIVETLVVCSTEYSLWLENKLRPSKGIGWNMASGGEHTGGDRIVTDEAKSNMRKAQLGRVHPMEVRSKISESVSRARLGIKHSSETREKISLSLTGKKLTEESIQKAKLGKFYFYLKKNREVYSRAADLYNHYLSGVSSYSLEKSMGLSKGSLDCVFKHFKNGWNPLKDDVWLNEYNLNNQEAVNGSYPISSP